VELKKERIEIREFFDSLVIVYKSGTLASYECVHERSQIELFTDLLDTFVPPDVRIGNTGSGFIVA